MKQHVYINNINDYITVDVEDYERVTYYHWYQSQTQNVPKITGRVIENTVKLEDFIMNRKHCYQKVKGLDYRKSNIGIDKQSMRYRKPQKNKSSAYKGVSYSKVGRRWRAAIQVEGKSKFLGYFDSEEAAAYAYDEAVRKYWNGEGYINNVKAEKEGFNG